MERYLLITNNPRVIDEYYNGEIVESLNMCLKKEDDLYDVMDRTRDLIHKGYILVSHPLAGSVKPGQNPYRSIILKENDKLDMSSLQTMENAIIKLRQFEENKKDRDFPDSILEDYQVIDYSLINSGIKSLK